MRMSRFVAGTATLAIATASHSSPATSTETITYTCDALGRLVAAQSSGSVNSGQARSLCYNAAGNRTQYRSSNAGALVSCSGGASAPTPAPSITISDVATVEGDVISFTVSLSAASTNVITVNYAASPGSADTADFASTLGTTFSAGQTSKSITLSTYQNYQFERLEDFSMNLSSATGGATIGHGTGVRRIYGDDNAPDPGWGPYICL